MGLSRDDRAALLSEVGLFASAGAERMGAIADVAAEITFDGGRTIVRQGEIGTGFFLIISGRARVVRDGETLAYLGRGEFFGELSILDQQPRIAQVVAEEPTTCLAIASWDFEKLLQSQPAVTLAILRGVARRLRSVTEDHRH